MQLGALLPAALALVGVAKAGALIAVGLALGIPTLLLSIAAALWVTGPSTAAWLIAERRRGRRVLRAATSRPDPAGSR